jgi:transcriptional regulator with XRE-family HTH domain
MKTRHIMKPAGQTARAGAPGRDGGSDTVWRAVGRQLALRRAELGLSAERVADGAGISAADYIDCENGVPIPAFLLGELAELLDCSVTWFFEGLVDRPAGDGEGAADAGAATYKVATVEHRIQALTDSFRKLDFEGQQHLLALSRALTRGGAAHD